jgi:hypothetical protein
LFFDISASTFPATQPSRAKAYQTSPNHIDMMSVETLPIAVLIVYAALVQPTFYCLLKHGRPGFLGWIVLQSFCFIRIIGSILQIHFDSTKSTSQVPLILNNIGLSPLLLGLLGILHEA